MVCVLSFFSLFPIFSIVLLLPCPSSSSFSYLSSVLPSFPLLFLFLFSPFSLPPSLLPPSISSFTLFLPSLLLLPFQVYAVEASDIAKHVSQLVALNGLGGQVEVLQMRAEEVELEENVDLIISEWMGTLLLV